MPSVRVIPRRRFSTRCQRSHSDRTKERKEFDTEFVRRGANPAFPDFQHIPARSTQRRHVPLVPRLGRRYFRHPVICSRPGQLTQGKAAVTVPKAAAYLDDLAARREGDVRLAWQVPSVQPVTVAERMEQAPYHHFRGGIFSPVRLHVATPPGSNILKHRMSEGLLAEGLFGALECGLGLSLQAR